MLQVFLRMLRGLPLSAAMVVRAGTAPAAPALSTAPASCSEFVSRYLLGRLPDGSSVPFALDAYSVRPKAGEQWNVLATLTLANPPYPAVVGQPSKSPNESRDIRITFDDGQLRARVRRRAAEIGVQVLGCLDANHLHGSTGDAMLGRGLGSPQPPKTVDE